MATVANASIGLDSNCRITNNGICQMMIPAAISTMAAGVSGWTAAWGAKRRRGSSPPPQVGVDGVAVGYCGGCSRPSWPIVPMVSTTPQC
jgi:hypothetical protein